MNKLDWGHSVVQKRVGCDGYSAEVGDIVKVVKGRKYPIGMKMVVADAGWRNYNGYPGYHDEWMLEFYDCNGINVISPANVVIVAQKENRKSDPEYRDVHRIEVCI